MPTEEFPRGPVRRARKGPGQGTTAPRQRETPQGKAGADHTGRSLARVAVGPDRSRARGPANRLARNSVGVALELSGRNPGSVREHSARPN